MFHCSQCPSGMPHQKMFEVEGYWVYECPRCAHRFADLETSTQHTEAVYGDDYFEGGKAGYPDYLQEREMLIKRGRYYGEILQQYTQPGEMLDVGAAAGFLLEGFTQCGWQGMGIEPNARMSEYAHREFGLTVVNTPLEFFQSDKKFDLISMIQVLPHFYDLQLALTRLEEVTKPGGYWLIETWNKDSLTARLTGKNWHEYSPPSVLHWFSPATVQFFGKQFGMKMVAKGRPSKKISAAHAKSLLSYKMQGKLAGSLLRPILKMIPDQLAIPYPAEDLFWMLLKKE